MFSLPAENEETGHENPLELRCTAWGHFVHYRHPARSAVMRQKGAILVNFFHLCHRPPSLGQAQLPQLPGRGSLGAAAGSLEGHPAYQNGGDDQGGVEEAVGHVGGIEVAVHAEAICHMPLANLRRPRRKDWEEVGEGGVCGTGLLRSRRSSGLEGAERPVPCAACKP